MRIDPVNIIRIPGKSGSADPFRDVQKGAELPARIIERIGGKEAILEIAGKRIRAEFLKGLPAGSAITLKLDNVRNNSYVFRMIDPAGRDALMQQVRELTIFSPVELQKSILHGIGTALARTPAGVLELNAFLLGMRPVRDRKEEGIAAVLNRLLKLGMSRQSLSSLSVLLSGAGFDRDGLRALLSLLVPGGDALREWPAGGKEAIADAINKMMRDLDAIAGEGPRDEIIGRILGLLAGADEAPAGFHSGEFAFWNGEEFAPVRYLGHEASWVFSMDLSNIGRTDILARKEGTGYSISVFSESEEASSALKESSGELMKKIADMRNGIHINFYITRQALNKIVEIYSHYSLNSVFDAKA